MVLLALLRLHLLDPSQNPHPQGRRSASEADNIASPLISGLDRREIKEQKTKWGDNNLTTICLRSGHLLRTDAQNPAELLATGRGRGERLNGWTNLLITSVQRREICPEGWMRGLCAPEAGAIRSKVKMRG